MPRRARERESYGLSHPFNIFPSFYLLEKEIPGILFANLSPVLHFVSWIGNVTTDRDTGRNKLEEI